MKDEIINYKSKSTLHATTKDHPRLFHNIAKELSVRTQVNIPNKIRFIQNEWLDLNFSDQTFVARYLWESNIYINMFFVNTQFDSSIGVILGFPNNQ